MGENLRIEVLAEPGNQSSHWVMALHNKSDQIGCGRAKKRRDAEFKALERLICKIDLEALNGPLGENIRLVLRINRGMWKEWILLAAFRGLRHKRPSWAKHIRRASVEEEAQGIDLVLITDRGAINIQLKSSNIGVKKFLARKPQNILIVRFTDDDSPHRILATLLRKSERKRRKLP